MNGPVRPLQTADLLGINLANLLDMHAGTLQRLQARLQGVDDAAALDDDADVAPLIAFGCHAAGQVVAALEEARARMPGEEIRLPEYVDDAIADIALMNDALDVRADNEYLMRESMKDG